MSGSGISKPPGATLGSSGVHDHESDSFADDAVAARKGSKGKRRKASKAASKGRASSARIQSAGRKVQQTQFHRAKARSKDEERAKRFRDSGGPAKKGLAKKGDAGARAAAAQDVEAKLVECVEELANLLDEIEAGGLDTLMKEVGSDPDLKRLESKTGLEAPMAGQLAVLKRLLKRMRMMEIRAKFILQHVMAGGTGLAFTNDPWLTFKRLFERIKRWPQHIPPGRQPESDEDLDAFISWVFCPPDYPAEDIEAALEGLPPELAGLRG